MSFSSFLCSCFVLCSWEWSASQLGLCSCFRSEGSACCLCGSGGPPAAPTRAVSHWQRLPGLLPVWTVQGQGAGETGDRGSATRGSRSSGWGNGLVVFAAKRWGVRSLPCKNKPSHRLHRNRRLHTCCRETLAGQHMPSAECGRDTAAVWSWMCSSTAA